MKSTTRNDFLQNWLSEMQSIILNKNWMILFIWWLSFCVAAFVVLFALITLLLKSPFAKMEPIIIAVPAFKIFEGMLGLVFGTLFGLPTQRLWLSLRRLHPQALLLLPAAVLTGHIVLRLFAGRQIAFLPSLYPIDRIVLAVFFLLGLGVGFCLGKSSTAGVFSRSSPLEPIEDASQDRFGYSEFVEVNLYRPYTALKAGDSSAWLLLGPRGSGKSSCANLLKHRITAGGMGTFCPVLLPEAGLGTAEPVHLAEVVLSQVHATMAKTMFPFPSFLYKAYAGALELEGDLPWYFAVSLRLLSPSSSLVSITKDLLGRHIKLFRKPILIFLDDMDRCSPEMLAQIPKVVHYLTALPNTLTVMAAPSIHSLGGTVSFSSHENSALNREEECELQKFFHLVVPLTPPGRESVAAFIDSGIEADPSFQKSLRYQTAMCTIMPPKGQGRPFHTGVGGMGLNPYDMIQAFWETQRYNYPEFAFWPTLSIREAKKIILTLNRLLGEFGDNIIIRHLFLMTLLQIKMPGVFAEMTSRLPAMSLSEIARLMGHHPESLFPNETARKEAEHQFTEYLEHIGLRPWEILAQEFLLSDDSLIISLTNAPTWDQFKRGKWKEPYSFRNWIDQIRPQIVNLLDSAEKPQAVSPDTVVSEALYGKQFHGSTQPQAKSAHPYFPFVLAEILLRSAPSPSKQLLYRNIRQLKNTPMPESDVVLLYLAVCLAEGNVQPARADLVDFFSWGRDYDLDHYYLLMEMREFFPRLKDHMTRVVPNSQHTAAKNKWTLLEKVRPSNTDELICECAKRKYENEDWERLLDEIPPERLSEVERELAQQFVKAGLRKTDGGGE